MGSKLSMEQHAILPELNEWTRSANTILRQKNVSAIAIFPGFVFVCGSEG